MSGNGFRLINVDNGDDSNSKDNDGIGDDDDDDNNNNDDDDDDDNNNKDDEDDEKTSPKSTRAKVDLK